MARSNEILLNGMVMQQPQIMLDSQGHYMRGSVPIQVIRGNRDIGNNQLANVRYDAPIIMSGNPSIIEDMVNLKPFDMVEIKGVYTTRDIKRTKMCSCGNKISKPGTLSFISPIYIEVRETGLTEAQAKQILDKRCEVSNSVTVIGNVTSEPEYTNDGKLKMLQYTIAVARQYFLKDDSTLSKVDYPHIKAYGKNAEKDHERIKTKTQVMIKGMLQTRQYTQKFVCEECGQELEGTAVAMEIIPYSTEYLKDFITNEEIAEKNKEKANEIEQTLFG